MAAASSIDWSVFQPGLAHDFGRMLNFEFTYDNVLYWLILVVLCVLLKEAWGFRKTFFFALTISGILLGVTQAIAWATVAFSDPHNPFDPTIIKFVAFFFMVIICFLYTAIKGF